eukprot:scpid11358/ scgid26998/ 
MMIVQVAERHSGESYKDWSAIPTDFRYFILDLGRLEFNMLNKKQPLVVFTYSDLSTHAIGRGAKPPGLLMLANNTIREHPDRFWIVQSYDLTGVSAGCPICGCEKANNTYTTLSIR